MRSGTRGPRRGAAWSGQRFAAIATSRRGRCPEPRAVARPEPARKDGTVMATSLIPLVVGEQSVLLARIDALAIDVGRLPYTLRVLLENVARAAALGVGGPHEIQAIAAWEPSA